MENSVIIKWYNNKTKLHKLEDIKYLQKYLVGTDQNISGIINFSMNYKFDYFDIDKMNYKKIKVRPENIFKINFYRVIKKMINYFPNMSIQIFFEKFGDNDNLIKKQNSTFKHDVYIKISNNNNFYDIGLEYFEIIHDRIKDNDKEISSKINLDGYYVYNEKDCNYNDFMKETIYSLFLAICALSDDSYTLSKINYFKNYCNSDENKLKKDTELFNTIIEWKKLNLFDLKNFFEKSVLINPDTEEEFSFQEFIEYLYDNFRIKIIFLDEYYNCEYKYFVDIIMNIGIECSDIISSYRKIYSKTMEILFQSEKELVKWISKSNQARRLIPKYIDNFLLNHLKNYRCHYTLEKIHETLTNKYSL